MRPDLHKPATTLHLETLVTGEALEGLRPEWTALWEECPDSTVFQSPEWLLPWWRHFGGGSELRVLVLRDGERLVGLAPCSLYQRTLVLLGNGLSDYGDVLLAPDYASAGVEAIAHWLEESTARWDDCDFRQLRPTSPLLGLPAPAERVATVLDDEPCLELPLAPNGTDTIPDTFLSKLRYEQRRLQRSGTVVLERAHTDTFAELFDAFVRLHGSRWSERAQPGGVLADAAVTAFQRDASRGLLARDLLRLHALRLDGRIVACCHAFSHRHRVSYYLGGFDPAYEKLGVGNQVVLHAIEEAAREGADTFDFLRGQEGYKYRWGAQDQPTHRLQFQRPTAGAVRAV